MKSTARVILICMLIFFAFLTGFTYRDLGKAGNSGSVVATLNQVPSRLVSAVAATVAESGVGLSPVNTYSNVFGYVNARYYGSPDYKNSPKSKEVTYSGIRGMMSAMGDRYTRFLDPEEYKQMREDNSGNFQGIGAMLEKRNGEVIIKKPIQDSPAIRAGLKENDAIIRVNSEVIQGLDIDEVVKRIRGPRGTKVTLTIRREGVESPFDIAIIRDIVKSPVVEWEMKDDEAKIGYIALMQFNEKSDQLFDQALGDLEAKGMKGLVLDLRGNPGGLLNIAVDIGSRFIDKGNIVLIQQNDRINPLKVQESKHNHKLNYPMAVVINGMSASASEILAGAIRDHKVGTVVGTDSFGKGLVQTIINLPDDGSAVAITTAKYLTPNGRDVNKEKIHPDLVVEDSDDPEKDPQLDKAIDVVREKLGIGRTASDSKDNTKS